MARTKKSDKAEQLTKPTAEPAPPAGTVAYLLAGMPSIQEGETAEMYTHKLARDGVNAQVSANAYRLKLGIALLLAAPKAREGRLAWEEREAERLGLKPRQLRKVLGVAKAVRLLAPKMPIAVLDRPLAKLAAAANAIKKGIDPDAVVEKTEKPVRTIDEMVDLAVKKLESLIGGAPAAARAALIKKVTDATDELALRDLDGVE